MTSYFVEKKRFHNTGPDETAVDKLQNHLNRGLEQKLISVSSIVKTDNYHEFLITWEMGQ